MYTRKELKNLDAKYPDEGFTLIELLIVMSIILILMTLAMPQAMKVYKQAHETSAIQSLRAIGSAESSYASSYPANGFSCALAPLGGTPGTAAPSAALAQVLDPVTASGAKSGYLFSISNCTKVTVNNGDMFTGYKATAVPASVGKSGDRGYCMDENNLITYDEAGGTNCTKPLQ